MMLLKDLCRGLWETLRETLPGDERELGVFLAGFTYAFVVFICLLIGMSWATARLYGWPL